MNLYKYQKTVGAFFIVGFTCCLVLLMGTNVFAAGIKPVYSHPVTDNVVKGDEEGVTYHKNQSPHFHDTVANVHEYTANYLDGPNDMIHTKDGTYITKFNAPVEGKSIFSDSGDYSKLSNMKISYRPTLGLQGQTKTTFIPKSQNEPWLGGELEFDGLYPVSASLIGSTLGDFPNGNYGSYVRYTFPAGTDARAMGKAINWDTVGTASHLTWSFLGVNIEDLISAIRLVPIVGNGIADTIQKLFAPVFDMGLYVNFPLQWYPRWARWSVEDPNSLYLPIRGADYPKISKELKIPEILLPDVPLTGGYASFITIFDTLGRLNINQIPGLSQIVDLINRFLPSGIKIDTNIGASTDGPVEGHFRFNLDKYTGNLSSKEVEEMVAEGAPESNDFSPTMQGIDNSPGKLLTKHALPPSETNRFLLKYNATDNTQIDSGPGLIVPTNKRDFLYAYLIKGTRKEHPFPNQDIQTWSSYFSPIDGNQGATSLNTQSQVDVNGQYINNDKQQEFQEIVNDQYTMSLPGANFRKRRVVMDYVKDGNFTKYDHGQFLRVIDFFKRTDITPKVSLLNLTSTLLTGDPDDPNTTEIPLANYSDMDNYYDQWMKVYYNGTAPSSKAWGGQKGPINDNTLLVYQYLDPTHIKLNTKEPTKVNINGSLSFKGQGFSNVKAVKNLQLWYKVLPKGQSPYTNPDAAPSTDGWQKGPSEDIASGKTDWSINTGNLTNLGQYTVYVRAQDNYGVWSQDNLETQHVQTNKTVDTLSADFEVTDNKVDLDVTKKVVDQTKIPNPKDSDYRDSVTGLPGNKFRYHIRINATNGTTDHIIFKDNDLTDIANFDEKSENYAIIHHNDSSSDETVKLTADDFTNSNTVDFSKKFKSDQIGNGAYIDLYFTVNTFSFVTPVGTVIPNTAHIISTSGGDNDGHGWASNTANINLYPDPIMTKQVKLASDKDSAYTDKLEAGPDSDLDYRVQIKPNKDVKDPELNEIKLSDPFNNKLNQGLTLKKVTANYYDADNKIINDQTEVLTPDSHQVVALSHPVVPGGHVDVVYQVHLDQDVPAGTTFKNIAYMESSSYGKNADHQLPNWQTNNVQVTVKNILSTNEGTIPMGGGALGYTLGSHMYVDKLLSKWDYANQDKYSGLGKFNFYFKDNDLSTYATLFRDYQNPVGVNLPPRLNSTSTIMVGVDGAIPQGGGAASITNITKNSSNSGPYQTVDFEYDIAISAMKFHVRSTLKPTPYGLVTANDHITNISGKDLTDVTFGRVQDTTIGTDWKGEDGVPIYYIGHNNGLYIKSGNHQLSYYFKRENGPQGWKGTKWDPSLMEISGESEAFYDNDQLGFKGPTDHNQAATNAKAGTISNNNGSDTAILMKWDPVTLKNGASIDRSFDIGVKNTEEKAPELTLDQTDQSYPGGDVALSGQVKDDDSPTADLYYSIDDGPKQTIADKYAVSSTWKKWNGKIPAEQLSLGRKHIVKVWAIDPNNNYSTVQTFNLTVTNVKSVSQTVENVTTGVPATNSQVEVNQDDQVRYTFTANFVKYGDTNPLNNIVLTTDENNKQYAGADGKLSDISDYPIECSLDNGKTWIDISKDNPTPNTSNGVKITIPDKVKVDENDTLLIRYSKKVTGLPAENKYFYNDGNVAANDTSETASANNTKLAPISDSTVNFKYVDLDTGKEIADHDSVQVTGKVGHKVSEYTKDQLAPAYIDGYTVIKEQIDDQAIQQATKADPVIAQKQQTYTYYYEKAALSMEAPKNWNFGKYNTSQTEATYYLPARQDASGKTKPYTVDIHDAYGVKDWTLKVQQKHQFTGINPVNKKETTLSGAQLNFAHLNAQKTSDDDHDTHPQGDQLDLLSGDQFKLPVGNEIPTALMSYHNAGKYVTANDQNPTGTKYDSPGVKSFAYQFGDKTNAGYSIGLHVPASTKREATDYTTTLTWSLSVAP